MEEFVVGHLTSSSASNFSKLYETTEKKQVSNTYSISGTLCIPKGGAKNKDHVQYLIHGVGFDSRYVSNTTNSVSFVTGVSI
jgi:hypothetical protein